MPRRYSFAREALELEPESAEAANILAWLLATSPDGKLRNAKEAVERAEKANELTHHGDSAMIDTLAAAYAEAGRFDDARKWIAEAIKLAQAANRPAEVEAYQTRQKLYEAGKPFYEEK